MSKYIGNIISKTTANPTFAEAPGVWKLSDASKYEKRGKWPVSSAQYDQYTTLLLNGDGTNGAQNNTFIDSSNNALTITRAGNTTQGSFNPYGDRWSNYFDGTGDYLYSTNQSNKFCFDTDATAEMWFYPEGLQGSVLLALRNPTANYDNVLVIGLNGAVSWSDGNAFTSSTTVTYEANKWNHVAVVKQGTSTGNLKVYLNGVLALTIPTAYNPALTVRNCYIGVYDYVFTSPFKGYISDVRIVKGTGAALYTGNFTPTTAPLTAIANTSLLTCQSNRFKDHSTNNFAVTRAGDVKVRPFSPYASSAEYQSTSGASAYFDGTGDYLDTASSSTLTLGTGDFKIEFWTYLLSTTQSHFYEQRLVDVAVAPIIYILAGGSIRLYVNGADRITGATLRIGEWTHVVVSRVSGTTRMFINGTQSGSNYTDANNYLAGRVRIGTNYGATGPLTGYITDVKTIVGSGVTSVTVPTTPLTAETGTSLLLNFKNAGIVDATAKNTLETVGNAQINTTIKKYGTGSLAFDGTGDYLSIPYNQDVNITSGDFTIEGWVYFNSVAVGQALIFNYNAATNFGWALYTSANGTLGYYLGSTGTTWNIASGVSVGSIVIGQWYHFALVRSGSTFTPYLNAVAGTTTTSSSTLFNGSLPICVGGNTSGGNLNGYLDGLRITKGVAKYTG